MLIWRSLSSAELQNQRETKYLDYLGEYNAQRKSIIIPLYTSIARSHLEYCTQAWRPYRQDIDILERVQLWDISCEMRLRECDLTTLETRRLRRDQIEVFKILNEYENIYINIFYRLRKRERLENMKLR